MNLSSALEDALEIPQQCRSDCPVGRIIHSRAVTLGNCSTKVNIFCSQSFIHPGWVADWKGILKDVLQSKVISFSDKNQFKRFKGHSQVNTFVRFQPSDFSKMTKLSFHPMIQ